MTGVAHRQRTWRTTVASLPALTLEGGGRVAIVTQGPTSYDGDAAVKLDGDVVDERNGLLTAL